MEETAKQLSPKNPLLRQIFVLKISKKFICQSLSPLLRINKVFDHTNWLQVIVILAAFLVRKRTSLVVGGSPNHPRISIISVSSII